MNKLTIAILTGISVLGIISCEDDTVSSKHEYTDEELIFRDSLEAAKQNVNADYVFVYDVTVPLDTTNYTGVEVSVDADILIEKLKYANVESLTTAMGSVSSGAQSGNEITFFAINASSRNDYTDAFTANGFGHWFDANGNVCSWGDTDMLFSELNAETFTFFIGQHPDRLATEGTYQIIQAMKKDDYRVAFVFNITVGGYYEE